MAQWYRSARELPTQDWHWTALGCGVLSPEALAVDWPVRHSLPELTVSLPKEPETVALADGARVTLSDQFGDAFGVLEGPREHLAVAMGRALDLLYDTEWGTVGAPELELDSGRGAFDGFGEAYVGRWRARGSVWLFAVVRPEREPLAAAFVEGASVVS